MWQRQPKGIDSSKKCSSPIELNLGAESNGKRSAPLSSVRVLEFVVRPKLLVSVRNQAEALAALAGGCDVLDVKEPQHGALGRANWGTISDISTAVASNENARPLSAALGELYEWLPKDVAPTQSSSLRRLPFDLSRSESVGPSLKPAAVTLSACGNLNQAALAVPTLSYVKLGLAGMRARATLLEDFLRVVDCVQGFGCESLQWIAVVYADWELANAPSPRDVLRLVDQCDTQTNARIGGLLIDTFTKGEQRLFDFASTDELQSLRKATRDRGLSFAVAGRLRVDDLERAIAIKPDIVAVRSAVCELGNRMNAVTAAAVAAFRATMLAAQRDAASPAS